MITILAEKPSVAREIARIVGAMRREEGYFTGNGYHVTWALGHLVQLALPDGYGIRGFRRARPCADALRGKAHHLSENIEPLHSGGRVCRSTLVI